MKPAVVLLSGGLDSATTLAIARSRGYECSALSFAYGQRHSRELDSASRVAAALGARNRLVLTLDLRAIGGSPPPPGLAPAQGGAAGDIGGGGARFHSLPARPVFLLHLPAAA